MVVLSSIEARAKRRIRLNSRNWKSKVNRKEVRWAARFLLYYYNIFFSIGKSPETVILITENWDTVDLLRVVPRRLSALINFLLYIIGFFFSFWDKVSNILAPFLFFFILLVRPFSFSFSFFFFFNYHSFIEWLVRTNKEEEQTAEVYTTKTTSSVIFGVQLDR